MPLLTFLRLAVDLHNETVGYWECEVCYQWILAMDGTIGPFVVHCKA